MDRLINREMNEGRNRLKNTRKEKVLDRKIVSWKETQKDY